MKKRSVGVTVLGVVILLYSFFNLVHDINFLLFVLIKRPCGSHCVSFFSPRFLLAHSEILVLLCFFIASIGILRVKKWGRILVLYTSILLLLYNIKHFRMCFYMLNETNVWFLRLLLILFIVIVFGALLFALPVLSLYFFTRSKVKEQFR